MNYSVGLSYALSKYSSLQKPDMKLFLLRLAEPELCVDAAKSGIDDCLLTWLNAFCNLVC